jgi:two-component system OmpR family response regulator
MPHLLLVADLEQLQLDPVHRRVSFGSNSAFLTRREFEVFAYLHRYVNTPVSRDMLGHDIWEEPDYALTNVIDVYINLLRRKLDEAGLPRLIHTVRGIGYTLRAPASPDTPDGSSRRGVSTRQSVRT